MIRIKQVEAESHKRLQDLLRDIPRGHQPPVVREYYAGYEEHKKQVGSFRDLAHDNPSEYAVKMGERFDFMYQRADLLARQLKEGEYEQ